MTRDEAKEAAMVMLAYANGEQVQVQLTDGSWKDLPLNPHFDWQHVNYRIKPEPKYRPFKSHEECWNEMHKHPDFGWVKDKEKLSYYPIQEVSDTNHYRNLLNDYEFTDGAPFGIMEE